MNVVNHKCSFTGILCVLMLLTATDSLYSQTIERELIGAGGGVVSNGNVTMSQTLGEVAITSIGSNPALRQGFLQKALLRYIYSGGVWSPENPVGVSGASDVVIVRNGTTTLTGILIARQLTIETGANLNLAANTVNFYSMIGNQGSIQGSSAILSYLGSDSGQITGNDFTISRLNMGGSDLSVSGTNLSIASLLDIDSGNLTISSGRLIFKSNAVATAMVDRVPATSSITGPVQVERYYQALRAFRFISSSVTTTSSIRDNWQEGVNNTNSSDFSANQNPNPGFGTHIAGSTSGSNGFDATQTGDPSLFTFSNTSQVWDEVPSTLTTTLQAGEPYRLFIRGDRGYDITASARPPASQTIIRMEGALSTGNKQETNLNSSAGGFNFIGNPYQASVDMNDVLSNSININSNFYYVWDPNLQSGTGAYVTVNLPAGTNTSASSANKFLQPMQGAFVTTLNTGAASLNFRESDKAIGQNTTVYSGNIVNGSVIGQLYKNGASGFGQFPEDSFGIYFDSSFTTTVNSQDAIKPMNVYENMAIDKTGTYLSLENRNLPHQNEEVKLFHAGYTAQSYIYRLQLQDLTGSSVYLKDAANNNLTLLTQGQNDIPVFIDSTSASSATDRFSLVFRDAVLSAPSLEDFAAIRMYPNPLKQDQLHLEFNNPNSGNLAYEIYTVSGQKVLGGDLELQGVNAAISGFDSLATGSYVISISTENGTRLFTEQLIVW